MVKPIKLKTKKVDNELGIIIPNEISREMNLKEEEEVDIALPKNYKPLKKLYGILERRIKESSQKMKDRLRKELY